MTTTTPQTTPHTCPECGHACNVSTDCKAAACPQCQRVFTVKHNTTGYTHDELKERAKVCASKGIDKREFVKSFEMGQRVFAINAWFEAIEA